MEWKSGSVSQTISDVLRRPKPELSIPALYAAFSAAWIAFSDLLIGTAATSVGEHTAWSIAKGFGFVAVTAVLLHAGVRTALSRERRAKDALREQLALNEQFRQAQKLESVGRLAGGVAHDFNNLLTIILGCADALRQDAERGARASPEDVDGIRAAGERARDLTRQLLTLARRQAIAPVPLDLNAVVGGSERLLRRLLGDGVELRLELQPDLWRTRGDPGQLEHLLLNLAANARDAMPRGGTLAIATGNERRDDGASAADAPPGEYVCLRIVDSGEGMSAEVKRHLFEPFFTTKPNGLGTGLGLATVYGIVKQNDGHVHVWSEPGRGAAFEIRFPRAAEAAGLAPVEDPGLAVGALAAPSRR